VVSGYLSGVGVLIAIGQLPKLFGFPKESGLLTGLLSPGLWKWQGVVVGMVTIVVMASAPRFTRRVPAAILGLGAGIGVYLLLALRFPPLRSLEGNPLVIGPVRASGSLTEAMAARAGALFRLDPATLGTVIVPAITLSVLLSIDTLKTCVGLDALTRSRHRSNRELVGQGLGNLAAFFAGGIPGAGTMGPTLVNLSSGGRTPRAGVVEGIFVLLAMLLLGRLIAWVPIGALAGILLVIAWRMFDRTMFRLLRFPAGRLDFAVIVGVILVALTVDLIAASGVGVGLAILLFIRDQVRGTVIRRKRYLNQTSSKTRRLGSQREILDRFGDRGVFCELQGHLFFGTTDQLFSQLETDLRTKRYLLFDMRRVQSMDYTAVHLIEQMHAQLAERGGQLLFSGMPSGLIEQRDFQNYLADLGVVREGGGVMVCDTLDSALEWMEERILEEAGAARTGEETLLELGEFPLFRGCGAEALAGLTDCVETLSLAAGGKVFAHGDEGDELYLLRRGSVSILLPLEGGKQHHLATIGQGDFFGEIAFLDRGSRSADVVAKVPTDLYVLSRARFNSHAATDPAFGVRFFASLALAIAERLRQADGELQVLEER
jgi:SulP family sulfate permease